MLIIGTTSAKTYSSRIGFTDLVGAVNHNKQNGSKKMTTNLIAHRN